MDIAALYCYSIRAMMALGSCFHPARVCARPLSWQTPDPTYVYHYYNYNYEKAMQFECVLEYRINVPFPRSFEPNNLNPLAPRCASHPPPRLHPPLKLMLAHFEQRHGEVVGSGRRNILHAQSAA